MEDPNVDIDELQSLGESLTMYNGEGLMQDDQDNVPDVMILNYYCSVAKTPKDDSEASRIEAENSWNTIREWLSRHSPNEIKVAAEQRGESGLTALHFACRNNPPTDVVDLLVSVAPETAEWTDAFGWLPIHYACASGSSSLVIKALVEIYPESKTATDSRGRTPLHFALGDKPAAPGVIHLLSSTGAAGMKDDIGMLPLHYACAFGASEEVLYVLTDAYGEAITTGDKRKRTPLHFALSNAGRKTVPSAVRLLLSLNKNIVNSSDGSPLPIRVLAEYARTLKNESENFDEQRESVQRCLEYLLNADPVPTPDFFTALQSLPDWLSERAVVMPSVQNLLNRKISKRLPTAVLMMDFVVLVIMIVFYSFSVVESIKRRFDNNPSNDALPLGDVIPLYLGAGYFLFREIVQIISLVALNAFKLWLRDPSNYLNIVFVGLVMTWAIIMQQGKVDRDVFRVGAAISVTILWVKLLAYLRNMLIDFAVFVGGVFYVVQRLAAFLIALVIILIAFAQMFHTVFQQSEYCETQPYQDPAITFLDIVEDTQCEANQTRPYCDFWLSFLNVYTMLLGEVDQSEFESSGVATALFIIFMFLVVILLANVLIAIVTDSYKVIQDRRAAIVFWTNRLDFVAEMDAINNLRKYIGMKENRDSSSGGGESGRALWGQLMYLYGDDAYEKGNIAEAIIYNIMRVIVALFVIPAWLLAGVLSFGWFWPPQIREAVFMKTLFAHSSEMEKDEELRKTQVRNLEEEVKDLREELLQELALDRTQVVQMKSQVSERKAEIANEMRDIKRIVAVLFERQASFQA